MPRRFLAPALFLLLCGAAFSQDRGFFLYGGGQYYVLPGAPFKSPLPGLRLGCGYALPLGPGSLSLAAESGFTVIGLEDSQTGRGTLVPLALRAEYAFYFGRLALLPGFLLGGFIGAAGESAGFSTLVGPRVSARWRITEAWRLYAGGGADFIPETSGLITLPCLELGLRYAFKKEGEKR